MIGVALRTLNGSDSSVRLRRPGGELLDPHAVERQRPVVGRSLLFHAQVADSEDRWLWHFRSLREPDAGGGLAEIRGWQCVAGMDELLSRTAHYVERRAPHTVDESPQIGCIILRDCRFFPDDQLIDPEALAWTSR